MGEIENGDRSEAYLRQGDFYGNTVNKRHCSGLLLTDLKHSRGRKLPAHSHELAYFCMLLDGDYSEHYGRGTVTYNPFTVVFHPPGLTHRDEVGTCGGRFFIVEVEDRWLDRMREYSDVPSVSVDPHGSELAWLTTRLYREYRSQDACSPLLIEGLVLEMLAAAARIPKPGEKQPPAWLLRAVDMLHAEFARNLTAGEVAAEGGVHPCHLSRVFRQFYRCSIGEYVQRLRVRYACNRLPEPGASLAEVALAAGFSDQSHFTRVFKQVTGMTPGAFRATVISGASFESTQDPR